MTPAQRAAALMRELAEPVQEPVAWMDKYQIGGVRLTEAAYGLPHGAPLYAATAERVRRVEAEKAQANVQVLVLTAVHHAVEACANATGQHRVIAHFVNKTHLANEVMDAVSSVAAEVRA